MILQVAARRNLDEEKGSLHFICTFARVIYRLANEGKARISKENAEQMTDESSCNSFFHFRNVP